MSLVNADPNILMLAIIAGMLATLACVMSCSPGSKCSDDQAQDCCKCLGAMAECACMTAMAVSSKRTFVSYDLQSPRVFMEV